MAPNFSNLTNITQELLLQNSVQCITQHCDQIWTCFLQVVKLNTSIKPFFTNLATIYSCEDIYFSEFLQGYFTKNLFIATQSPLAATVVDFWRMLWEHRSPIVVMVMERGVDRYWPLDRIKHCNHLSIEPTTERHSVNYTYREFKLTYATVSVNNAYMYFMYLWLR